MDIKEMLNEEFVRELDILQGMEVNDDGYDQQVKVVTDIADRIIAIEKLEIEERLKTESLQVEERLKTQQLEMDKELKLKQMETDEELKLKQINTESADRVANRVVDETLRRAQLKEDRLDHMIKNGITVVTFAVSTLLVVWGAKKSWEFEKEGTITSTFGRMFMGCFRHKA